MRPRTQFSLNPTFWFMLLNYHFENSLSIFYLLFKLAMPILWSIVFTWVSHSSVNITSLHYLELASFVLFSKENSSMFQLKNPKRRSIKPKPLNKLQEETWLSFKIFDGRHSTKAKVFLLLNLSKLNFCFLRAS